MLLQIVCAYTAGASIVKVYSVSALGGVQYIASLKKPLPHIPMVASQGITTDSVRHYITSAASAVVLSGATFSSTTTAEKLQRYINLHLMLLRRGKKLCVGRSVLLESEDSMQGKLLSFLVS
ncbi:unnamed protein product [Linum tenue]|uniref:Indole-3-glycerol-phosphate synthase n=1 Tax=Linum tenue TaxID=586396 RepID=A0AAV0QUJ9_9ROSI|nr:unnamed protein product [Linum tenue]